MKQILTFLLVLVISGNAYSQNKIELNLVKGNTYNQKMSVAMVIKQKIKESDMTINMTITGTTAFNVTGYEDGVYDINVVYKNLSMKSELPDGKTMSFDSEKDDKQDLVSMSLGLMKDKAFYIKMNKQGKVLEVSGIDKIYASVFEKFPNLDAARKQQLQTQIEQSFGEKTFKNNMENSMAFYPKTPVAKGGRWSSKNTMFSANMAMEVENNYKLDGVTTDQYLISGTSKISTPNSDTFTEVNGVGIKTSISGFVKADMKIDRKTGWILEAKTDMSMNGNISIKANEKLPEGMTIPMEVSGKATLSAN